MYKGGPKYLFEEYLKLFKDICFSTIHCVETIDEWKYNVETTAKVKYTAKHHVKLRRPAFMWRERIVKGERVTYRSIDYVSKLFYDNTRLYKNHVYTNSYRRIIPKYTNMHINAQYNFPSIQCMLSLIRWIKLCRT